MEDIVSGAKRRSADSHRQGSGVGLALVGTSTNHQHNRRGTISVRASSDTEDLPNSSYMRNRGELGEDTVEVARPGMNVAPSSQAGEQETLRVQDKRGERPSRRQRAAKQLHDGLSFEQPLNSSASAQPLNNSALAQPRKREPGERIRLSLAPFAAAAG